MTLLAKTDGPQLIRTCSIWRALEAVGDYPSLLILQSIWLGDRRFSQFEARTRVPKALLSDRLRKLIEANIISKQQDRHSSSKRLVYLLTRKGLGLYPVALMLLRWEQNWPGAGDKPPIQLIHAACGAPIMPVPVCGQCGEPFSAHDLEWSEGPGVGWMAPLYTRRRQRRDWDSEPGGRLLYTESAQILGDRWANLILRSILLGLSRFGEIMQDTAIAPNILSERLAWLSERGVIETRVSEDNPAASSYRLTAKGADYIPVLVMLQLWGDSHYAAPEGPPVILVHKSCGHVLKPAVACSHCDGDLLQENTYTMPFAVQAPAP